MTCDGTGWWPFQATSPELARLISEYTAALQVPLTIDGVNMGLDVLVSRVAAEPATITLVASDWPIPAHAGVRVVPIRPVPLYPWYAVWRSATTHPLVRPLVRGLRAAGDIPDTTGDQYWLPASARSQVEGQL
jgi:hypothetical protein